MDWKEIIQTFFRTNSKEDVLNLITLNPCDEEDEKVDGKEIIQTFFRNNSKEDILNLIGLEDSHLTSNTAEELHISECNYIKPHYHINDIKKIIAYEKRKVKQISFTRRKPKSVTFICDECHKEFPSWWLRRKHWIDSEHKAFEICTVCNKPFIFLQKHIYIKHSETLLNCSKCGKAFISQTDVDNHLPVHSRDQNLFCFVCNKNFHELEALIKHVKTHFNLVLLMCDVCELEFVDKALLEEHTRLFHFTCPLCDDVVAHSANQIQDHYQYIHKLIKRKCEQCNKCFQSNAKLKEHIKRDHLKQLPFTCSECGLKLVSVSRLKTHITFVHKPKQFECDICQEKFYFEGSLISHKKIHSGLRKEEFKCEFCNAVYVKKVMLEYHLHGSSYNRYSCKQCEKNFSCRTKYKEHTEWHKEKNLMFKCDYCPFSNASDSVVKNHMSKNHKSEYLQNSKDSVSCPVCGYLCSSKHTLCRHQRRNHGLFTRKPRKQIK